MPEHPEAAQQVLAVLPDWGHAVAQLNDLVAERMGVTTSDLDCLHTLNKDGPATATALAGAVGLTLGSVSRMIDRLEAAGCVTRVRDPDDRRKVLVEPTALGLDRVWSYYVRLAACTLDDLSAFTDAELAVVLRFVQQARTSTEAELARLRNTSE